MFHLSCVLLANVRSASDVNRMLGCVYKSQHEGTCWAIL